MLHFLITLRRRTKHLILLGLDVVLVPISVFFALLINTQDLSQAVAALMSSPATPLMMLMAGGLAWHLGLNRVQLKSYELSTMGLSAILASILAGVLAGFTELGLGQIPGTTPIVFAMVFLIMTVSTRMAMLQILKRVYQASSGAKRVMIYGAGQTGIQLANALRLESGIQVVGYLDDNRVLSGVRVAGYVVHPAQRLEQLIQSEGIEKVILAMPSVPRVQQAQIARRIEALGVDTQTLPSFSQLVDGSIKLDRLATVLPKSVLGRGALDQALIDHQDAYHGKSVLITGAGGSIGSELCRQVLACQPERLILLERGEFALFQIDRELRTLGEGTPVTIVPTLGCVTDTPFVRRLLAEHQVNVVLHAAAYKHVPLVQRNPVAGVENNVFGTLSVVQAAHDARVERFVLVSTDKAVRPKGLMGATKRLAETIVADYARRNGDTVFTMVRFGNVLGSSGSVMPIFQEQISRGGPVTITDRDMTRYFMTINEACNLVLCAGKMAIGSDIFVLDMGEPVRIEALARQMIAQSGFKVRDAQNPEGDIEIQVMGLREGEKLYEELSFDPRLTATEHPKLRLATDRFQSEFELARVLQLLRTAKENGDAEAIVTEIQRWIERDRTINTTIEEAT